MTPFPCDVLDTVFSVDDLGLAAWEFGLVPDAAWHHFDSEFERGKRQLADPSAAWTFPAVARVLDTMTGADFVGCVEAMTGIPDLVPDLTGGAMHETHRGGFLSMHVDSATDFDDRHLYRRVNALLYLNRWWEPSHGGALVLGTRDHEGFIESTTVDPIFGRLVVFATTGETWHGHPEPWTPSSPRRSLAVYYYTEDMPAGFDPDRRTTFTHERP